LSLSGRGPRVAQKAQSGKKDTAQPAATLQSDGIRGFMLLDLLAYAISRTDVIGGSWGNQG
jgi:hypothetical protein